MQGRQWIKSRKVVELQKNKTKYHALLWGNITNGKELKKPVSGSDGIMENMGMKKKVRGVGGGVGRGG